MQQRLTEQLGTLLSEITLPEEDPFLADLLWWKGEEVAVVEVSLQVNGNDVARAALRAATLRRARARALAVVIGKEWATREVGSQALARGVEWSVGGALSEGFLAFRRLPST
ncbi:MAG: hypothetical protein ACK4Z6_02085 [Candidatus Methylomirabilales bacterium]